MMRKRRSLLDSVQALHALKGVMGGWLSCLEAQDVASIRLLELRSCSRRTARVCHMCCLIWRHCNTYVKYRARPASPVSAGNSCLAAVCLGLVPEEQSGSQESLLKMLDACAALGDSAASMLRMAASMSSMAALQGLRSQQGLMKRVHAVGTIGMVRKHNAHMSAAAALWSLLFRADGAELPAPLPGRWTGSKRAASLGDTDSGTSDGGGGAAGDGQNLDAADWPCHPGIETIMAV
jgi:hypothetical protein